MVKGKEWLKEEVDRVSKVVSSWVLGRSDNQYWKNNNLEINKGILFELIDQLEEPSVSNSTIKDILKANKEMSKRIKYLESEFESETNFYTFDDAKKWLEENGYVVTEKPVVPQFVADWFEKRKTNLDDELNILAYEMGNYDGVRELNSFGDWFINNENTLLILSDMRYGYEVEKEKLYYIKLPTKRGSLYVNYDVNEHVHFDDFKGTKFRKSDIEAIDERYWQFAEEVKE